ncbi:MAG TPA: aldolase/citrate lyase family protein [Nitrososphaerales archaeon]|nr:aldolase/citrate lyase family protein [Nitrososphaerales archaeon]
MNCDLKRKLGHGDVTFGTWVSIGHTDVPDILETLGFDWLVFDTEHAPLNPAIVASMIQAVDDSKVCPIVRVGAPDQYLVKLALDMGAHGVLCPLVNSGAEAKTLVGYAKYPPSGIRGVAPRKAADYGLTFPKYLRTANDITIVAAQIETRLALDSLDEIASTPGVDILFVGPTDLTVSLGLLDDRNNAIVVDAMRSVVSACERRGKWPGVLAATPEEAKRDVELGFKFIGLGSDVRFMTGGARAFLQSVGRA